MVSMNLPRKARGALEKYLSQEDKQFHNIDEVETKVKKILWDFKVDEIPSNKQTRNFKRGSPNLSNKPYKKYRFYNNNKYTNK